MGQNMCDSCGMPLSSDVVAPKNVTEWTLCKYCVEDSSGKLWARTDILSGMRDHYFIAELGMKEEEAEKAAQEALKKMPAWKDSF
ncbi:hypothetical protein HOF40_00260 [Candidatus Parcubacteria bacterium]|nr:hypothetical protein [Candidatus Parcubacteria bacterium]MBT3948504.1 hypothetical protein [Candidatus Parcubacteria bacterium]